MAAYASGDIEPTMFDVVVCGTGLPEAVLAAACAAAGKTVLHVDPNPFYGSHSSSIPPLSLPSFLLLPTYDASTTPSTNDTVVHHLQRRSLYSEIETSGTVPMPSGRFAVDLVGPRVLYCADEVVDLLLRSGGSNHVEFKSVDGGTLLYWDGALYPVPNTRENIFQDTTIPSVLDKYHMYAFFKLVRSNIAKEESSVSKISEEDLNIPFIEFLKKQKLPPKMIA
jgi:RAB protein geranylgeranyltransferase component A